MKKEKKWILLNIIIRALVDIIEIMIEELTKLGRTIIYCGIVPTPTIQFMVHSTEAVGGFIVTASHNPIEWNGIKFVKENSTCFNSRDCEKLFDKADNYNPNETYVDEKGIMWEDKNSLYKHSLNCTELKCIDIRQIRNKKYKVVIVEI